MLHFKLPYALIIITELNLDTSRTNKTSFHIYKTDNNVMFCEIIFPKSKFN